MTENIKEYEIFGHKVRLNSQAFKDLDPQEIINYAQGELDKTTQVMARNGKAEVALLTLLRVCAEKKQLEETITKDIAQIQNSASDALHLIEEVSPSLS